MGDTSDMLELVAISFLEASLAVDRTVDESLNFPGAVGGNADLGSASLDLFDQRDRIITMVGDNVGPAPQDIDMRWVRSPIAG